MTPSSRRFELVARVSSDSPSAIKPVLEKIIGGHGRITPVEGGFEISAELKGEAARDLNRSLLSELRRAEKRTRIRAEWKSGNTIEKFFDYVPKGIKRL